MVKPACKGTVIAFRYGDDIDICCQYLLDAERIKQSLAKRLEKFKLQLNEEKTKLVAFDKKAMEQGVEQGTFDFLGFTFYLGKARSGRIITKLKTRAKTLRMKLKKVNVWMKQVRNKKSLKEIWKILKAKIRGHVQYYGVSHNSDQVEIFLYATRRVVFKWLNRRSQRKSFTWEQFQRFLLMDSLPKVKIVHRLF